jgi:hypothetical protein
VSGLSAVTRPSWQLAVTSGTDAATRKSPPDRYFAQLASLAAMFAPGTSLWVRLMISHASTALTALMLPICCRTLLAQSSTEKLWMYRTTLTLGAVTWVTVGGAVGVALGVGEGPGPPAPPRTTNPSPALPVA